LTYLSWAWAWAEFKKKYPTAKYLVNDFNGAFCTGNEKMGYMVQTSVTADDLTYEMWLPVMDMRNNAILAPKMTEINKTIMRCLTKNLAMFGLGLYIYAGEDLPESTDATDELKEPKQAVKRPQKQAEKVEQVKPFKPLTRAEMMQVYGIKEVEKTLLWLEEKLGAVIEEWNEEQTAWARGKLQAKKEQKQAEKEEMMRQAKQTELPF
jgi:hypothetical protein